MSKKPVIDPNTPALAFITIPGQQEMDENGEIRDAAPETVPETKGKGVKSTDRAKKETGPIYTTSEKKTERLQLVFKPSTVEAIKNAAWANHQSVNSYIEDVLTRELEKWQTEE